VAVSRVALETALDRQVLRQAGVTKTNADRRISLDALKIQMLTDFRDQVDAALAPADLELSPDAFVSFMHRATPSLASLANHATG